MAVVSMATWANWTTFCVLTPILRSCDPSIAGSFPVPSSFTSWLALLNALPCTVTLPDKPTLPAPGPAENTLNCVLSKLSSMAADSMIAPEDFSVKLPAALLPLAMPRGTPFS